MIRAPHAPNTNQARRERGIISWFNSLKGSGMIRRDSGGELSVHFSAIRGNGYRELDPGERVEFSVVQGPKGITADDVVALD